jgi:DNA polymerase
MDFETYSPVNLINTGVQKYARHPDADVICGVFSFIDAQRNKVAEYYLNRHTLTNEIELNCFKEEGFPVHFKQAQFIIAHNIEFDLEIYIQILEKKYNFLEIDANKKLICTKKRQAFLNQVKKKSSLGYASEWFGLNTKKSRKGKDLIEKLSIPDKKTGERNYDDALETEMLEYCVQDVKTLECLFFAQQDFAKLFRIKNNDFKIQTLDLEINRTGFPVNLDLAAKISEVAEEEKANSQLKFCQLFDDFNLPSLTQDAEIKKFIKNRFGYEISSFTDNLSGAPAEVAQVLDLRENVRKSSLAKAEDVLAREVEGRIYGAFQYAEARTGRWAGYGVQPHNFPRTKDEKDPKSFLRNLIATGADSSFIILDYSQIEHRAVFYMLMKYLEHFELKDESVERHFNNFFTPGIDSYLDLAADIYDVPVESLNSKSPERVAGKTAHLGLAYAMGKDKFYATTKKDGVDLARYEDILTYDVNEGAELETWHKEVTATHEEECARIVKVYREKYPTLKKLWAYLNDSFIACVRQNEDCVVDLIWDMQIRYVAKLPFRDSNCLSLVLPNGRPLFYHELTVTEGEMPWGSPNYSLQVEEKDFHGGKILENIIQGLCRDLLAEHMLEISGKLKLAKIVLHVHDEIGVESLDETLNFNKQLIEDICKTPLNWMSGFPLSYETMVSKFYRK